MIRRLCAALAVSLLLIGLTPGTAKGISDGRRTGVLRGVSDAGSSAVAQRPGADVREQRIGPLRDLELASTGRLLANGAATGQASRDWRRPALIPLIVAPSVPPTPLTSSPRRVAQPTEPVGRSAQPTVPSASASPTLGTTRGPAGAGTAPAGLSDAQTYARTLVSPAQWPCLRALWQRESGWRANADNPHSSAYGIAQRLDETSHDPHVQIRRGLDYIAARYGDSCTAWQWWQVHRWY